MECHTYVGATAGDGRQWAGEQHWKYEKKRRTHNQGLPWYSYEQHKTHNRIHFHLLVADFLMFSLGVSGSLNICFKNRRAIQGHRIRGPGKGEKKVRNVAAYQHCLVLYNFGFGLLQFFYVSYYI